MRRGSPGLEHLRWGGQNERETEQFNRTPTTMAPRKLPVLLQQHRQCCSSAALAQRRYFNSASRF